MASKNVLTEAINKLVNANHLLLEKIEKTNNNKEKTEYRKEMNRNQSMILDYKFRLEYE